MKTEIVMKKQLKAIIVDDEAPARLILRAMLEQSVHDVEVVAEADGVEPALEALENREADILFLDVNLSPGSGFDILQKHKKKLPEVIFITAHDEFAIRAIRSSALDYLVKPVVQEDLDIAIGKCEALAKNTSETQRMEIFRENLDRMGTAFSRIVLPTSRGFKVVPVSDIMYCEADRSYTQFHMKENRKLTCSKPLRSYEELLSTQGFFRCHQSWLINLGFVSEYERRKKGGNIIMSDGSEIPLSETARKEFQEIFLTFSAGN
jgi:two-component system LytT family response regulator